LGQLCAADEFPPSGEAELAAAGFELLLLGCAAVVAANAAVPAKRSATGTRAIGRMGCLCSSRREPRGPAAGRCLRILRQI
jgi:hypothetical protein